MPLIKIETASKLEQFDLKDGKKQFIKSGPNKGKAKVKLRRAAKYEKMLDIPTIYSLMQIADIIVLEKQSPRPGNGSAQCARTMVNFGRLLALAELNNSLRDSETVIVLPQMWKKDLHITMTKDEKKACGSASLVTNTLKAKACSLAKHLFKDETFVTPKGKMLDGQAEACLIGHWYINKDT